ncbi:MAG: hypothetical protein SGJ20_13065, partial [Planctomycetota bacterium]|nr:hypothetical protein [Planctomycetota bacterium]
MFHAFEATMAAMPLPNSASPRRSPSSLCLARLASTGIVASLLCCLTMIGSATVHAQGLLVHIHGNDAVPLPRPIIIYPPWPQPTPRPPSPRPPQQENSYKIKSL